jgi:hypothetical protein
MLLGNATRGRIVAKRVVDAPTGLSRLWVLRREPLANVAIRFRGPGFWVPFGRPPVDVVFLDRAGRVVGIAEGLRAWRGAGTVDDAVEAVVLEGGACVRVPIEAGDRLEYTPHTSERISAGGHP